MTHPYSNHSKFYVAVDCIIFGFDTKELKLLCIRRNFEPGKGQWSLMGGFLEKDETTDEAAARVLHELTGIENIYLEQLQGYSEQDRDPADRVISIAYYALINSVKFGNVISDKYNASWFNINQTPDLIFDHKEMVDKALRRLRRKCSTQPVGFELLPEKFTLPQLQNLYEKIFDTDFDKRNFRKKILSPGILRKLEEKERQNSRKGAFYYQFDEQRYEELTNNGYNFDM